MKNRASSSSTVESVGNGFVVYGQLTSGSLWASMTFLFTVFNLSRGSQLWRECVRVAKIQTRCLRITFAGFLPTVRRLPAVALALYFN